MHSLTFYLPRNPAHYNHHKLHNDTKMTIQMQYLIKGKIQRQNSVNMQGKQSKIETRLTGNPVIKANRHEIKTKTRKTRIPGLKSCRVTLNLEHLVE